MATIAAEVQAYLAESRTWYARGEPEYYARIALDHALRAHLAGNYGIGAVLVAVSDRKVYEFRAGNAMVSGQGIVDHAETRALLKCAAGKHPDAQYARDLNDATKALPVGVSVYGTVEPCPLCTSALTNARIVRSVSTVPDGALAADGVSDGGANVIGAKSRTQPLVWQHIQAGLGITFSLLQSRDTQLKGLSWAIFADTRGAIDDLLAQRSALQSPRMNIFPWRSRHLALISNR